MESGHVAAAFSVQDELIKKVLERNMLFVTKFITKYLPMFNKVGRTGHGKFVLTVALDR